MYYQTILIEKSFGICVYQALFVGLLVSTLQAQERSPYALPMRDGLHAAGDTRSMTLKDGTRNKDLTIRIHYPKRAGKETPFPVILFSHGLFGSKDGFAELGRFLATHGYVSIHPSHADSIKGRLKQRLREGNKKPGLRGFGGLEAFRNRAGDLSFLMGRLGEIEKKIPGFDGRLDPGRIGIGGHSYGAFTTQLVSGAPIRPKGETKFHTFKDGRPKAFVVISGHGEDEKLGLRTESWKPLTRPTLYMTGSKDVTRDGGKPEWRKTPYLRVPPGHKYLLWIEDARHFSFSGKSKGAGSGISKILGRSGDEVPAEEARNILEIVNVTILAFWDAHLKEATRNSRPKAFLRSKQLESASRKKGTLSYR